MVKLPRVLFGCLVFGSALNTTAQTARRVDLAVTYSNERSLEASKGQNFWSQGGSVELGANVWRGLGMAAKVTGLHAASVGSSGIPLSMVSATFGPRYRWHADRRLSLYGEGLLGEADAFRSLFPAQAGAEDSASSLALQVGGGIDVKLTPHVAVRALEANWLRTQLPNGTNDRQNSLHLGAGVVVRFGR